MSARREELQAKLETILPNVYFQAPDSYRMCYPCIRYKKDNVDVSHADDQKWNVRDRYQITIIEKNPESTVYKQILEQFTYSSYDRSYISDGLYHTILTLYY